MAHFKNDKPAGKSCPLCGSSQCRLAFSKKDYDYHRCLACGHVYVFPPPTPDEERSYYDTAYPADYIVQSRPWFEVLAKRRMDLVESYFPRPGGGAILDAGCGYGLFLAEARRRGWNAIGIETASEPLRFSRGELGLDIRAGDILSTLRSLRQDSIDVITFWHVLEHVSEPGKILETAVRKLSPNGLLILNSPNIDSLIFKLVGRRWSWIYTPGHTQYFSLDSLRSCCENLGLRTLLAETWTGSPNLFFMLEETCLLRISDAIGAMKWASWRVHQYETRLRTYVYSPDHQERVQAKIKAIYERFPRLDAYLRRKNLGHELALVMGKP